jgi:hypothetical protein
MEKSRRIVFLKSEKVALKSTSSKAHITKAALMNWFEDTY